eukprot:SM000233S07984  [mRNA]  locus=s233:108772:110998:+ [translate_table: standard]
MEFVSPEGLRLDGRRPRELRQLRCEAGVLPHADGSASFEMGNTKVVAAVFGPHEVTNRSQSLHDRALVSVDTSQVEAYKPNRTISQVKCEYSMAVFSTGERRRRPKGDRRSTEISLVIGQTIESAILGTLLPQTQIDIFVQVIQADGGTRCAALNAASLAIADAGIPMRDMVAACAAGYLDGTPLLDLNYLEDAGGGPDLTVGLHPSSSNILLLQMDSKLALDLFEKVLELAILGCKAVAAHMREAMLERTQQLAAVRGSLRL